MKKYLNKSIFYQGDLNLFPLFIIASVIWAISANVMISSWGMNMSGILYNSKYYGWSTMFTPEYMVIFAILLTVCFLITVGNKRKKWKQLMIDNFTRKDIRNREMILIYGLLLTFIVITFASIIIYYIQNRVWLQLTDLYFQDFILDIIKMGVLGFLGVTILFLIDSFVINNIACAGFIVFLCGYIFVMTIYHLNMYHYYFNGYNYSVIDQVINVLGGYKHATHFLLIYSIVNIVALILGIGAFILTRKLITKIKIENMNGFFVVQFNKKIVVFMLATIFAVMSVYMISIGIEIISYSYVEYYIGYVMFVVLSIIYFYILNRRDGLIMRYIKS